MTMKQISTKGLLLKVIVPAAAISVSYFLLGQILSASKRKYGAYSLKSAFAGQ